MPERKRIAPLINYENASHAHGNWNSPSLSEWITSSCNATVRIYQRKKVTDFSLIIDKMGILYSNGVDVFH